MRVLIPFLLILTSCGLGAWPWDYGDNSTYVMFKGSDCNRWGLATVDMTPSGQVFIYVKQDVEANCEASLTEAVMHGLRERGAVHGEELRVLDAELWEPTKEAVELLNAEEGDAWWPAPVRHVPY